MNSIQGAAEPVVDQHVFLVGRPPISEFVLYYRNLAIDARSRDEGMLMDEWRSAHDRVRELESTEAGFADDPPIAPLAPEMEELGAAILADAQFRNAFRFVPVRLGMVELDRMVVFQKHVNLAFVRAIHERLGTSEPGPEELFRLCIPLTTQPAPIRVAPTGPNSFTFVSPSHEFRFVEPMLLSPDQILRYEPMGPVSGILGLVVGYGPNYLNAMHAGNRLILSNGSHRAFALRERGITHVPCVIQELSRPEELEISGAEDVRKNPNRYLAAPRPPVLKDYFDDRLRKLISVARKHRTIKLTFGYEVSDIPA